MNDLTIAEIHQAIRKLGGSAEPTNPEEARQALRDLGADVDLRSIVDSWQDTFGRYPDPAPPESLERRPWTVPDNLRLYGARFTTSYRLIA